MKRFSLFRAQDGEVPVDETTFAILCEMIDNDDTIINANKSMMARVLNNPFWFEIPAMNLKSDENMAKVIMKYWMPWCKVALEWWHCGQVIPYYSRNIEGIPIPQCPEKTSGLYRRVTNERGPPRFKWYWSSSTTTHDPRMHFIVGHKCPDANGLFRCDLISLIPYYRMCKSLMRAMPGVIQHRSRPTHLLERRPPPSARHFDDNLTHLSGEFGARVVGATRMRQDEARYNDDLRKQQNAKSTLIEQQRRMSSVEPILLGDTGEDLARESDTGLATRMFILPEDTVYRTPTLPDIPFTYAEAKRDFDIRAAAIMDYPQELISSSSKTNVGKAAALKGAETFIDDRIRNMARFFEDIVHQVLTQLYKPHFNQMFKNTDLHPTLDVIVKFSITTNIPDEVLYKMYENEIISKETLGKYLFRNHNIPEEELLKTDGGGPVTDKST